MSVWGVISIGEKLITAGLLILPLHHQLSAFTASLEAPLAGHPNLELLLVMGAA